MDLPYTYIVDLVDQLPDIPEDSIVSRTIYSDKVLKGVLFGFAPGEELSEHTSTKVATIQILQGEAELTLGEDAMMAGPGTWVHMPPNLPHSILAKTKVVMLLTMVSP